VGVMMELVIKMELEGHDEYIRSFYTLDDGIVSYSYGSINMELFRTTINGNRCGY